MQIKGVVFFLAILILSGFVIAQSQVGKPSNSIEKKYSLGDSLKGWINISLSKESANSFLETNFGGKINVLDFLKQNEISGDISYTCSPIDCESDFASVGGSGEINPSFNLADEESRLVGLRFAGGKPFQGANSFSMNVDSNAPESTFRQLSIDILDDGAVEWQSYKSSNNFYNEYLGCYDVASAQPEIDSQYSYCEKINVPISPEVEIGAYVVNNTNPPASATFTMSIISEPGSSGPSCEANTVSGGRIGCVPNFKINEAKDYYVCIKAKSGDGFKYKINSETNNSVCGYSIDSNNPMDFEIFAKPAKFATVGNFVLDNTEANSAVGGGIDIEEEIEDYIISKYNGDCTEECIVPIRITSGKSQQQDLSVSVVMGYVLATPHSPSGLDIYNITETPAEITSQGFMQLFLDDANFSAPDKFGEQTLTIKLGGTQIISEKIEVEKKPEVVAIFPSITVAAFPTEFSAVIETFDSPINITNYDWNFGDNTSSQTTKNSANHTYNRLGTYPLTLTITDIQGHVSSKTFDIEVATPKKAVNDLLKRNIENIDKTKTMIDGLSVFERDSLNLIMDFSNFETQISALQQRNATAVSDEDYVSIMKDLILVKIPDSIDITKSVDSLLFYPLREDINLDVLQKAGGGDFADNEEKYIDAVVAWELSNTQMRISSKEFTANYQNSNHEILNTFEINVNDNPSIKGSYLIMPKFDDILFSQDYSQKEEQSYIYMQLNGGDKITFSTTEDIEFAELPAFISPPLSRLSIQKGFIIDTEKISKQTLIILVVLLVTFLGFIIYLVMQQWYKRKYENYLFKSKNDLFNIVSYIQNMKKQGVEDKKVESGLRKSGWNSEQVTYIIRKYYGKRTGMFEIPLSNIINLFRGKADFNNYPKK